MMVFLMVSTNLIYLKPAWIKGFKTTCGPLRGTKNSFEITTQYLMTSVAFRYSMFLS